jgi:ribosome-binding protein aMBF1 (putative translation factor)
MYKFRRKNIISINPEDKAQNVKPFDEQSMVGESELAKKLG